MRIVSIEPTPSPHSMKVNVDETLPGGVRMTYTGSNAGQAPEPIRKLLAIPGVASVFRTADFIAVDREPKADWQAILTAVREVLGEVESPGTIMPGSSAASAAAPASGPSASPGAGAAGQEDGAEGAASFGEFQVLVQKFRGIPLQIRIKADDQEVQRVSMPQRFIDAALEAQYGAPNLIAERKLDDYGIRYGDPEEIVEQVLAELEAAHDDDRLKRLIEAALAKEEPEARRGIDESELARALEDPDWRVRYAALERLKPEPQHLPLIVRALDDEKFSIRRLATVYLGDIGAPDALPYLYRMLKDPSAPVRRTAGDCLSDIGDPDAIGPMCEALRDPSKIVRWRAARFLYEVGDEQALPALKAAKEDPEFEIRMQIEYAIARIEGGEAASGSVWQQMTQRRREG